MRLSQFFAIVVTLALAAGSPARADDLSATTRDRLSPSEQAQVSERTIGVQGATSIRVRFDSSEIDPAARIILIAEDGDRQTFDAHNLLQWSRHSAIFNGSRVRIRIEAPAGASVNYAATALKVDLQLGSSRLPGKILGADHRVSVADPRVGRVISTAGPCSGWLTSIGAVLTAGHCPLGTPGTPTVSVIQFNVPPSRGDGVPISPPSADQYPVKSFAISTVQNPPGRDWQIAAVLPNGANESAYDKQKAFFRLSAQTLSPTPPTLLQIIGFGQDRLPVGSARDLNAQNLTEQTDVGILNSIVATPTSACLSYLVDTDGGNSGSPVFLPATDIAVGIHTWSGDCAGGSQANAGTLLSLPALGQALATFPTTAANIIFVDGWHPNAAAGNGSVFAPFQRLSDAIAFNGGVCPAPSATVPVISVVSGQYEGYSFKQTNTCAFKIIAPSGSVLIGPRPIPARNP